MAIETLEALREKNISLKNALMRHVALFHAQQAALHTLEAQSAEIAQEELHHLCERERWRREQASIEKEITVFTEQVSSLSAEMHALKQQRMQSSQALEKQEKSIKDIAAEIAALEISKHALVEAVSRLEEQNAVDSEERVDALRMQHQEVERKIEALKQRYVQKIAAVSSLEKACASQKKEYAKMEQKERVVQDLEEKLKNLRKAVEKKLLAKQENENKEGLELSEEECWALATARAKKNAHIRKFNAPLKALTEELKKKAPVFSQALRFYEATCENISLLGTIPVVSNIQSYFLLITEQATHLITEEHIHLFLQLHACAEEQNATHTLLICERVQRALNAFLVKIFREKKKGYALLLVNTLYAMCILLEGIEVFYKKHGEEVDPEEYEAHWKEYLDEQLTLKGYWARYTEKREDIRLTLLDCASTHEFTRLFIEKTYNKLPQNVLAANKNNLKGLNAFFLLAVQHGLEWPVSRILVLGVYKKKPIDMYQTAVLQKGNWRGEALPLLHLAAICKYKHIVQLFLDRGFDIHYQDSVKKKGAVRGWTALHYLVANTPFDKESVEILQLLLARGAAPDISAADGKTTPLSLAKEKRLSQEVIVLLESAVKAPILPPASAADAPVMSPVQGIHFFGEGGSDIAAASEHKLAL